MFVSVTGGVQMLHAGQKKMSLSECHYSSVWISCCFIEFGEGGLIDLCTVLREVWKEGVVSHGKRNTRVAYISCHTKRFGRLCMVTLRSCASPGC